ncbi:MAG TPA: hypothetical protein PKY81_15610 [bacterium]|nr:hypothetical protein [bacterium]
MLKKIKRIIYKKLYYDLDNRKSCVLKAAEEQGLMELISKLEKVIDNEKITQQYTNTPVDAYKHPYWINKLRAQHSFQISMVLKAIDLFNLKDREITIVDIGDSAGSHILYFTSVQLKI